MTQSPRIISLQVGLPQQLGEGVSANKMFGRWSTGIFKQAVSGPVMLRKVNLDGDGQADLTVHGGPDKAVLAYAAAHYPAWRAELDDPEFPFGAFGENFTVSEFDESTVSIGDIHVIGEAVLQISQPRAPCWKLARKWNRPDLPALVVRSSRSGWYYRVLQEGNVEAGSEIVIRERPCPEWRIAKATELAYSRDRDPDLVDALAACPLLSREWQAMLWQRS
jgi:MOSC domain-containing protein YiiM